MIEKAFGSIEKKDIDLLVQDGVREGRTLEYKASLPGTSDGERQEFLRDVASLANAAGGDIIFGVTDSRDASGKPTGIPDQATGLADVNADDEILRFDQMIRSGTKPAVQGARLKPVDGFRDGPVVLLRVPRSWIAPPTTRFDWRPVVYSRTSVGKYPLDFAETKAAILGSEELPNRVRSFRDERLARIVANEGALPVDEVPRIVLHMVPLNAAAEQNSLDPRTIKARLNKLEPLAVSSHLHSIVRTNFDGVVSHVSGEGPPQRCSTYVQVFRCGAIEALEATLLRGDKANEIPIRFLEQYVIDGVNRYLAALSALGVGPPIFVLLTLIGVKGLELPKPRFARNIDRLAIDRDILVLPEVVAEEFETPVDRLLRPVFDAVWNACDYDESLNYDEDGNWAPR